MSKLISSLILGFLLIICWFNCVESKVSKKGTNLSSGSLAYCINRLSLSFYSTLPEFYQDNVIFSPLSIITGLGMLMEAARGSTQQEIIQFLSNGHANQTGLSQLRKQFKHILKQSSSPMSNSWQLDMANLVMVAADYPIETDFSVNLAKIFDAKVSNEDFATNGSVLVDSINLLVANKTKNMIKKALDGPIDPETRLMLINTVAFEGEWIRPFIKSMSVQRPFYSYINHFNGIDHGNTNGTTTLSPPSATTSTAASSSRVTFMTTSARINYADIKEKDMRMIELDYIGNASMIIILPNQRNGLYHLVRNLTVQEIDSYIGDRLTQSDIDIEIPKFTFEVQYDLMERLQALGLSTIFTRRANYDGITRRNSSRTTITTKTERDQANKRKGKEARGSLAGNDDKSVEGIIDADGLPRLHSANRYPHRLYLSSAVHKSVIKVDERGTKAAAFSGFGFHPLSTISGQDQFIADHPFLFLIRDKSKGVNIFSGAINKLIG